MAGELAGWKAAKTASLLGQGGPSAPLFGHASVTLRDCILPNRISLPDIDIAPGETVALVGPSGTGRTSALRVMAGLLSPVSGMMQVAGHP